MANREQWFSEAVQELGKLFVAEGKEVPEVRVSTGWPSKGGTAKKRVIGQCWSSEAASDGVPHIFISPVLDDSVQVLGVLVHEMVHAVCGKGVGHKGEFVVIAKAVGLTGPWTATQVGEDLIPHLTKIVDALGEYPHVKLNPGMSPVKKQTTRMIKLTATGCCEYLVRTTQKHIDSGLPFCPCGNEMEVNA